MLGSNPPSGPTTTVSQPPARTFQLLANTRQDGDRESRLREVTPEWGLRQCTYRFPGAFASSSFASSNATGINAAYNGWNTAVDYVVFASGTRDPWKEATVAADASTNSGSDSQPHLLSDGFHCSDMIIVECAESASVQSAQDAAVGYIAWWIS